MRLGPVAVEAYLSELSLPGPARRSPSVRELRRLHERHTARFAHDTIWIARDRIPAVTAPGLVGALLAGEGGVCTQLGVAFAWLLGELGYDVRLHRARVQFSLDDGYRDWPLHPVLTVRVEGEAWYADVGMGNGMHGPVPLREGTYEQPGGFTCELARSAESPWGGPDEHGSCWEFRNDPRLRGVRRLGFDAEEVVVVEDFAETFEAMVREETSPFRRTVGASIRDEHGVTTLNQDVLTRQDGSGRSRRRLESAEDLVRVLREQFGVKLPDLRPDELEKLWRRVSTA